MKSVRTMAALQRAVRLGGVRATAGRAWCSAQAEPVQSRRVFADEELIAAHEQQVGRHIDIYWPVLYLLGAGFMGSTLYDLYLKITTKDHTGKALLDDLIFHKKDKILGDKPQHHNTHPTLLIDVYDLLVCMTYRDGSKYSQAVKRPGMETFLNRLKDNYEIVIYSLSDLTHMNELFQRIDPQREVFSNIITRELIKRIDCGYSPFGIVPSFLAPRYKKNLNDVGRRLERVIHIECEEENLYDDPAQDDNRIIIPKYDGSDDDHELIYLIPFLDYLSDKSRAPFDVRRAIRFYKQKAEHYGVQNIGVAYILYQEEKLEKQAAQNTQPGMFSNFGLF
eukprot:TRINITY_DN15246_c0_g1_i1.p1 TRINITY_DN15246_c0_g1~~TRINITY_DN15246_c0_g1_i1.p1  ORF type:complete len:336 (+),score=124.43 TRINITY_DN15246_c0_g1_i1:78-1085(+)